TVNSVLPGPTRSEGVEQFVEGLAKTQKTDAATVEKEFFRSVRPSSLLKRFATPEEVAAVVGYVCSNPHSVVPPRVSPTRIYPECSARKRQHTRAVSPGGALDRFLNVRRQARPTCCSGRWRDEEPECKGMVRTRDPRRGDGAPAIRPRGNRSLLAGMGVPVDLHRRVGSDYALSTEKGPGPSRCPN